MRLIFFLVLALLATLTAYGDLGIEYSGDTTAVISRSADGVYCEACPVNVRPGRRGCSAKELGQLIPSTSKPTRAARRAS